MLEQIKPPPLQGVRIISTAFNVPGPVAAARLVKLGASVTKIEPPFGDPLKEYCQPWYEALAAGQERITLDLKNGEDREQTYALLEGADLLLTAQRPAALARLGLAWDDLHPRFPHLNYVAIVGFPGELANEPGHDLTYQAELGLLSPPNLPRTLIADLAGAEQAVSAALALLYRSKCTGRDGAYVEVAISEAARVIADPLTFGATRPDSKLGGGSPIYNLYQTRSGWIAVAALEPHFIDRLKEKLGLSKLTHEALSEAFRRKNAAEWEAWARSLDLPIRAVV